MNSTLDPPSSPRPVTLGTGPLDGAITVFRGDLRAKTVRFPHSRPVPRIRLDWTGTGRELGPDFLVAVATLE